MMSLLLLLLQLESILWLASGVNISKPDCMYDAIAYIFGFRSFRVKIIQYFLLVLVVKECHKCRHQPDRCVIGYSTDTDSTYFYCEKNLLLKRASILGKYFKIPPAIAQYALSVRFHLLLIVCGCINLFRS